MMYKLCRLLFFALLLPLNLQAGILTFDLGMRQSFIDYAGYNDQKLILPEASICIGGKTPGWHVRVKLSYSKDNILLKGMSSDYKNNDSSSLRMAFGFQKIFNPFDFLDISPFLYFALSYRISENKMRYERAGFDYEYGFGYSRLKRLSIPISAGVFKTYGSLVFSLEAEVDVIPIYSSYQKELFSEETLLTYTTSSKWYNECNLSLSFQIGFHY